MRKLDVITTINGLGLANLEAIDRVIMKAHGFRIPVLKALSIEPTSAEVAEYAKAMKKKEIVLERLQSLRNYYLDYIRENPFPPKSPKPFKIKIKGRRGEKRGKSYEGFRNTKQTPKPKKKVLGQTPRQKMFATPEKYRGSLNPTGQALNHK